MKPDKVSEEILAELEEIESLKAQLESQIDIYRSRVLRADRLISTLNTQTNTTRQILADIQKVRTASLSATEDVKTIAEFFMKNPGWNFKKPWWAFWK